MAYSSLSELPPQVRLSFSKEDQASWMEAYNSQNPQTEEQVLEAQKRAWRVCKDKPSSFSFSAYASVDDWDIQGERIDIPALLNTMSRYLKAGGGLSYNHSNYVIGNVWDYEPIKKDGRDGVLIHGNLYGGDDGVYDDVRKRFIRGTRGFSVAGESGGSSYVCDSKACGRVLRPSEIMEIALTPKPANPHAITIDFHEPSSSIAKSDDGSLKFDRVEVHMSEMECPILKLRKALRDKGVDAHARDDGVFVPFACSSAQLENIGLIGVPVEGGTLLNERDEAIRKMFTEGFAKGSLSADGRFSDTDLGFFAKACDMGLVESDNGVFRLSSPEGQMMKSKGIDEGARRKAANNLDPSKQTLLDVGDGRTNLDRRNGTTSAKTDEEVEQADKTDKLMDDVNWRTKNIKRKKPLY